MSKTFTPQSPLPDWRDNSRARPGRRLVLFEEGIASDTDLPDEFNTGRDNGEASGPRPNHNQNVFHKSSQDVMRERAHVGSASWVDSPAHLKSFVEGTADSDRGEYAYDIRDEG